MPALPAPLLGRDCRTDGHCLGLVLKTFVHESPCNQRLTSQRSTTSAAQFTEDPSLVDSELHGLAGLQCTSPAASSTADDSSSMDDEFTGFDDEGETSGSVDENDEDENDKD